MLKQLLFIVFISLFFYSVMPSEKSPFVSSLFHIEIDQAEFLHMITHEHSTYIAKLKAKRIAEEKKRLAKIRKAKAAALAAKKERIRKAKIAKQKRLLALKRKRNRVVAKVDISSQRMKVYKGGKLLHRWKVSTGKRGFNTPTGIFKPTAIEKMHFSKQYDNAPMPYAVFFNSGIAIHGTKNVKRLGRRASHGCVRVRTPNARKLYALIQKSGKDNAYIEVHR